MKTNSEREPEYLTIQEAARVYSVSTDWLYRNTRIPRVTLGARMVRIEKRAMDAYFNEHRN
jgi:hypothetical protein